MLRPILLSMLLATGLAAKPTPTPIPVITVTTTTGSNVLTSVTVIARPTPIVAYNAVAKNVVDGDTFDVAIDVWTNTELKARVRLSGVDTPELHAKDAKKKDLALQAKAFTEAAVLDKPVLVMRVGQDSFGRTLAKVLFEKNGQWLDLGDELVKAGLAIRGYDPSRF